MCVNITLLKSLPNLPGANELMSTEFSWGNIDMYLHFISFLHSEIAPVVAEIFQYGGPWGGCWFGKSRNQGINSDNIGLVGPK